MRATVARTSGPAPRRRPKAKARSRVRRPGETVLGGIVETLEAEHTTIRSLLDALETEAARLAPGKVPDYHLLLEIVDYLVHFPDCYHHPREDLLFAGLSARDPGFQPKFARLQREHRTLHGHNLALHEELRGITAGKPAHRAGLSDRIGRYVVGYRQHLAFESIEIFPRAQGTLGATRLRELEEKTRFIDDPLFGTTVRDGYRRIARRVRAGAVALGGTLVAEEMLAAESLVGRLAGAVGVLRGVPRALFDAGRERAPRDERSLRASPSWQARVFNTVTRFTIKPLMKRGSVESMRAAFARIDAQRGLALPADVRAQPLYTPGFDGEWLRIAGQRTRRVVLYFPGGGFFLAAQQQHRLMLSRICREAGARGFLVNYRLAPENPFPSGLENCIAAYRGLLEQGVRPQEITLGGDSAGGGLVLSTLLALRDEGTPLPARAFVLSPLADLTYSGGSRRDNACADPMLPADRASKMNELYVGESLPGDRYVSPVLADFDGLPPMLGQVGSTEILLDDTVRASQQAAKAGVRFYLEIWDSMPHVFPISSMLPESTVAIGRIAQFVRTGTLDALPARHGRSS